jgi:hypothetical protein
MFKIVPSLLAIRHAMDRIVLRCGYGYSVIFLRKSIVRPRNG